MCQVFCQQQRWGFKISLAWYTDFLLLQRYKCLWDKAQKKPFMMQISPITRMLSQNLTWTHVHSKNTCQVILSSCVSNKCYKEVLCIVEILKSVLYRIFGKALAPQTWNSKLFRKTSKPWSVNEERIFKFNFVITTTHLTPCLSNISDT